MTAKRISRAVGLMMLAAGLAFVWYALHHPELSWPRWFPAGAFYGGYLIVQTALLIAPFPKKKPSEEKRDFDEKAL